MYKNFLIVFVFILVIFSVVNVYVSAKDADGLYFSPNPVYLTFSPGKFSGNFSINAFTNNPNGSCITTPVRSFVIDGKTFDTTRSLTGSGQWYGDNRVCGTNNFGIQVGISGPSNVVGGTYSYNVRSNIPGFSSITQKIVIPQTRYRVQTFDVAKNSSSDGFNGKYFQKCNSPEDYTKCALVPIYNSDKEVWLKGSGVQVGNYIGNTPSAGGVFVDTINWGAFGRVSNVKTVSAILMGSNPTPVTLTQVFVDPALGLYFTNFSKASTYEQQVVSTPKPITETLTITPTLVTLDVKDNSVKFKALLQKSDGSIVDVSSLSDTSWSSSNSILRSAPGGNGNFDLISNPSNETTVDIKVNYSGLTASARVIVPAVAKPSLKISASSVDPILAGSSGTSVITVFSSNISEPITLKNLKLLSSNVLFDAIFNGSTTLNSNINETRELKIVVPPNSSSGTGSLIVTAKGGGLEESVTIPVTVTKAPINNKKPDITVSSISSPSTAIVGSPISFSAQVINQGDGFTGGSFGNTFRFINTSTGVYPLVGIYDNSSSSCPSLDSDGDCVASTSYVFDSAGTWTAQLCAGMNGTKDGGGWTFTSPVAESNTGNNCTLPKTIKVSSRKMSGNISFVPSSSCIIVPNKSSCNVKMIWGTSNPEATSAITSNVNDAGIGFPNFQVMSGNTGTRSVVIPYPSREFFLYNKEKKLDQKKATAKCDSRTSWSDVSKKCVYPLPVVNLIATPESVAYLGISRLTWDSQNATTCVASGAWQGNKALSNLNPGESTGAITVPRLYTLTCKGLGGENSDSVLVVPGALPLGKISATPCKIEANKSTCTSKISWTVENLIANRKVPTEVTRNNVDTNSYPNKKSVFFDSSYDGKENLNRSNVSVDLTYVPDSPNTFYLYHAGSELASAEASVSCASGTDWNETTKKCVYPKSNISFSADPRSISYGVTSVLTWSSTNTDTCTASGDWSGDKKASPSPTSESTGKLYSSKDYTLRCTGTGGSDTKTVSVNVGVQPVTASISVDPKVVDRGDSSTIKWSSTNADTCTASGDWSGTRGKSGEESTGPLISTKTYTITCTGKGSSASDSDSASTTVKLNSKGAMTGTLTSDYPSCDIPTGHNSCNVNLSWNIENPEAESAVTSSYPNHDTHFYPQGDNDSGVNMSVSVPHSSRDFFLINNKKTLDEITITSKCESGSSWDNSICVAFSPGATLTADPSSIYKGESSLLRWSSSNAISCSGVGFDTKGDTDGQAVVKPAETTTYSVICAGDGGQAQGQATVTVTIKTKKPTYEEN